MQHSGDVQACWRPIALLLVVCALTFGPGLVSGARLTYHEAFVAQGAQEILESGNWWCPQIGGLPWLEKPPLPFWLAAGAGWWTGGVSAEAARLPSVLAGTLLVLGVVLLAQPRYGHRLALLAGAVQATTAWTALRAQLAEADILLACLMTWTLLAFDRLRIAVAIPAVAAIPAAVAIPVSPGSGPGRSIASWHVWRWLFFGLLSVSTLVKGTGFGAALVLCTAGPVLLWDRDRVTSNRLAFPAGWLLFTASTVSWPAAMVARYGMNVVGLWAMHVTERLGSSAVHGPFAGQGWVAYGSALFGQALPWAPVGLVGAGLSLRRVCLGSYMGMMDRAASPAVKHQLAGDRLLWCWAVSPLILVSLARARNAHYAIYALMPWSIWAASGLHWLVRRRLGRAWSQRREMRLSWGICLGLAGIYGLCFWIVVPWFDHRGVEWAFYDKAGHDVPRDERIVLLYDDWDRDAYPTPFGPVPHDLAVRLFYLNHPVHWYSSAQALIDGEQKAKETDPNPDGPMSVTLIGRHRDLPSLEQFGQIEILAHGPSIRWDRTYIMARLHLGEPPRGGLIHTALPEAPLRR